MISGEQYILLIREACILITTVLVAFTTGITLHYLAPLFIFLAMFIWREHEKMYPWLFAFLLFFSGEMLVSTTVLLFVAAFCTTVLEYKQNMSALLHAYWPLPATSVGLWLITILA